MMKAQFKFGKAIWLKNKSKELNNQAVFTIDFKVENETQYILKVTGATSYRIWVNNQFVGYGPARAPHGYTRIDEINITKYLVKGNNQLLFEVAGYYARTYYTIRQESFLQFELIDQNQHPIVYSEANNSKITAYENIKRLRKVERYSYQRSFSEVYSFDGTESIGKNFQVEKVNTPIQYLQRELPYPLYAIKNAVRIIESGSTEKREKIIKDQRRVLDISEVYDGYKYDDIKEHPYETLQHLSFIKEDNETSALSDDTYTLYDMGGNNTGFIMTDLEVIEDCEVLLIFDEKLLDGQINSDNWYSNNVIKVSYSKRKAPYHFESFESYGFKYLMVIVLKGRVKVHRVAIREYSYPYYDYCSINCEDKKINAIYQAAIETFRQNTLDTFIDCPSRERAGWLCDSYFTAQSEMLFSGKCLVEKVMLENYLKLENFNDLPKGMLPMCYPADHPKGVFIPQWAMWYIVELEQYFTRNKEAKKKNYKNLCMELLSYFKSYENEQGLLENLEGWNFIEWSEANQYVKGVHYPTNMMYARILELIGTWYEKEAFVKQAEAIKEKVISLSFNGQCFIDHAIRNEEGVLQNTHHISEVCQYYAIFFNLCDLDNQKYSYLRHLVCDVFGPFRKKEKLMPEIAFANAFIGNYLRMDILVRYQWYEQALSEIKEYFYHMAKTTGTLWEFDNIETGSLNHGFASYIGVIIKRCLDGLQ